MEVKLLSEILKNNPYPGRGIAAGLSEDGTKAILVYFIMGRSANSRNRVFEECSEELKTVPFDPSKVEDPSLIIYSAVKVVGKDTIVTNGVQTDAIEKAIKGGHCMRHALMGCTFEPDKNFTPRISAVLHTEGKFCYEMSILKSADEKGSACNRYFFQYEPVAGRGHFLHTYERDGDPLPSFEGEPRLIKMPNEITSFGEELWNSMEKDNKISLYLRAIDLHSGAYERVLYNKYGK